MKKNSMDNKATYDSEYTIPLRCLKAFYCITFSIALVITILISAIDMALYVDYGFYEKEYRKYNVNAEGTIVDMNMEDLMDVTKEMMSYLRGNRDNLVIETTIAGEKTEFFNDTEKSHMSDCKDLFIKARIIRAGMIIYMIIDIIVLYMQEKHFVRKLAKNLAVTIIVFLALLGGLTAIISSDFDRSFDKFHQILFDNNDWILDSDADRLVCIVPEGFFVDMGIRIAVFMFIFILFFFGVAISIYRGKIKMLKSKQTNNILTQDGGTHEQR